MANYQIKRRRQKLSDFIYCRFHDEILGCTHDLTIKTIGLTIGFRVKFRAKRLEELIKCDGIHEPKCCPKKFLEEMIKH